VPAGEVGRETYPPGSTGRVMMVFSGVIIVGLVDVFGGAGFGVGVGGGDSDGGVDGGDTDGGNNSSSRLVGQLPPKSIAQLIRHLPRPAQRPGRSHHRVPHVS
jgi:hypothetical protein